MAGSWRWPLLNLAGLVATVAVNGLANALPLNGIRTGDVINRDPVLFLPANWAFSIWGLIYLGLTVFAVYGLLPAGRHNPRLRRISPFFLASCVANCVWLFLWHWELLPLSMVAMLALLGALLGVYVLLRRGNPATTFGERLALWWPFSIYLGWVSVATIANATVTLARAGWTGWGLAPAAWVAVLCAVAVVLAVTVGLRSDDGFFAAVFVWAFVALAVRQRDSVPVVLAAGIVVVAAFTVMVIAATSRVRPDPDLAGSPARLAPQ